jgi:hypothetical protein
VKGRGARHAASYVLPLDDTGRILPSEEGRYAAAWLPKPVDGSYDLPAKTNRYFTAALASLDFAVLMTISFLNCTNVGTREVNMPPKLAAKHRRRHGRDPISFRVLACWSGSAAITAARSTVADGEPSALVYTKFGPRYFSAVGHPRDSRLARPVPTSSSCRIEWKMRLRRIDSPGGQYGERRFTRSGLRAGRSGCSNPYLLEHVDVVAQYATRVALQRDRHALVQFALTEPRLHRCGVAEIDDQEHLSVVVADADMPAVAVSATRATAVRRRLQRVELDWKLRHTWNATSPRVAE